MIESKYYKEYNYLNDITYLDVASMGLPPQRTLDHCEVASRWGKANGYKQWRYLFIPSKQVMPNSSFMQLAKRFEMQ